MSEDREEGFLARWSRRKRQAGQAPPLPEPPSPSPAAGAAPAGQAAPPEFDPASLPPVESLTAASDITAFLRVGVPAALRQAALRRIWSLDPAIRDFVGPADYAWDYNAPDGIPGFAPELVGDVKRLLAQAIGLVEEEEPAGEAAPPPDDPLPVLVEAEAPPPEPEERREELPEGQTEPAPSAVPGPTEEAPPPPAPVPPLLRRHGRALPS